MNLIWRFFSGADGRWSWQHLTLDQTILEASDAEYREYEGCVANAEKHGYRFAASKSTRPEQKLFKKERRSYVLHSKSWGSTSVTAKIEVPEDAPDEEGVQ